MPATSGSTLIDVAQTVEQVVARAVEEGQVSIDTELVWERTFYPRLALIQIAFSEDEWYLIDASVPETLPPLGPLLADPAIVKILHDAGQDLVILRRATGQSPRSVFDTRVAAGFAGLTSTISLGGLLQELTEIELAKTETRTDWFVRPLSRSQLDYAADDVRYLARARQILLSRAEEHGVRPWLQAELDQLDDPELYAERDARQQFERVKGRGRLKPRQLAVLRELTAWREEEARLQDLPRGRIVSDKLLLLLAVRKPTTEAELDELHVIRGRRHQSRREQVLSAVKTGLAVRDEDCPKPPPTSRFDKTLADRADSAIGLLEERSAERRIDHALVATRSEVRALLREGKRAKAEGHRLLNGWRRQFLGEELMELSSPG